MDLNNIYFTRTFPEPVELSVDLFVVDWEVEVNEEFKSLYQNETITQQSNTFSFFSAFFGTFMGPL